MDWALWLQDQGGYVIVGGLVAIALIRGDLVFGREHKALQKRNEELTADALETVKQQRAQQEQERANRLKERDEFIAIIQSLSRQPEKSP